MHIAHNQFVLLFFCMKVVRGTYGRLVSEVGAEVDEGDEDIMLVGTDRRIVVSWTLAEGPTKMLFLAVVDGCSVVRAAFVVTVIMSTAVTEAAVMGPAVVGAAIMEAAVVRAAVVEAAIIGAAVTGGAVAGAAVVIEEAGKTLVVFLVENLAVEMEEELVIGAGHASVEEPAGTLIAVVGMMLFVAEMNILAEGLAAIMIVGVAVMPVVGEEDVPVVWLSENEILIGGINEVLALGSAALVCKRLGGGERIICEGYRGMANVEIGLVDKEGGCLDVEGISGCLTWDRGTVTCENIKEVEDIVMEGDFMKVALVVAGAGKFLDEGVTVFVNANGGDKSEEVVLASALSLLEGIAWRVVGERATIEIQVNRVSRGRPVEVLWAGLLTEVAGVVLNDDRDAGEMPSLRIGRLVAASELVK